MNMTVHPFLKKIYKSSTSFSFYKEIVASPYAETIRYLFGFIACLALIVSLKQSSLLYQQTGKLEEWLLRNEVAIKAGTLQAKTAEPFEIREQNFIFYINPNATLPPKEEKYATSIMITQNKMYIKNGLQNKELSFSETEDTVFTQKKISKYKFTILIISLIVIFLSTTIGMLITKLVQIIIFSGLSFFNSKLLKINLPFEQFLNICTYAIIPPSLFSLLFASLQIKDSYFMALYFAMYTLFIMGAIITCKAPEQENKEEV